jgi:lipopolysaccharide O-acetyltransferase
MLRYLINKYRILFSLNLLNLLVLLFQFFLSKILFPTARIIRYPFFFRKEGIIKISQGFSSNVGLVIETFGPNSVVNIGRDVYVNYRLHIGCVKSIEIGDGTLFGSDCLIIDHSHGGYDSAFSSDPRQKPVERNLISSSIIIGSNCWFGDRVSVLQGVTIGDGCIVGVGSVVTKDLPAYTIAVGSPAVPIKMYDFNTSTWVKIH